MDKISVFGFCTPNWFSSIYDSAKKIYPDLKPPVHRPHITIVSSDKIANPILTREKLERLFRMNGKLCYMFDYENRFETNGRHVWVPVQCSDAESLRKILGFSPKPKINFHITVGFLV